MKTEDNEKKIEIKKYLWLISLILITIIVSSLYPVDFALGYIAGSIIGDGIIFTLILWFVLTTIMKKGKWTWYEWLNYLVLMTVVGKIFSLVLWPELF